MLGLTPLVEVHIKVIKLWGLSVGGNVRGGGGMFQWNCTTS
jgi:hypothetical protein